MNRFTVWTFVFLLLTTRCFADAAIHEDDFGGDFASDPSAPTNIGSLEVGVTTVEGVVITQDVFTADADIFTFTIDSGHQLDSLKLLYFEGEENHFIGFDEGNTSTDPNSGSGADLLIAHRVNQDDSDLELLPLTTAEQFFGGSGAPSPVGPGDYTVWLQENDPGGYAWGVDLRVVVAAVPEPSSLLALSAVACGVICRRRKR